MKHYKRLFLLSLPLLLTCCSGKKTDDNGGGKTSTPTPSPIQYREVHYDVIPDDEVDSKANANDVKYNADKYEADPTSPLFGKKIYWLGSSVTYGASSEGVSMADYLAAFTGSEFKKDAVSGTTIFCDNATADTGSKSYVNRLKTSKIFNVDEEIDAFVCQISTNDTTSSRLKNRGRITDEDCIDMDEFDTTTTLGGVEFIIAYVLEMWNCPIYFYSGSYFGDGTNKAERQNSNPSGTNYGELVSQVKQIADKWDGYADYHVSVIDLFNDKNFNDAVGTKYYTWATSDPIHPRKAGYAQWWTPYIQTFIENDFIKMEHGLI